MAAVSTVASKSAIETTRMVNFTIREGMSRRQADNSHVIETTVPLKRFLRASRTRTRTDL